MAKYTTVDEGYDVQVYTSFAALWRDVSTCRYHTELDEPLYLDSSEETKLTQAALKKELESGAAYIYESNRGDWTLKVERH